MSVSADRICECGSEEVKKAALFLFELLLEEDPQVATSTLVEVAKKNEELAAFLFRAAAGDVAPLYSKPKQ